jgi:hypothetical protein
MKFLLGTNYGGLQYDVMFEVHILLKISNCIISVNSMLSDIDVIAYASEIHTEILLIKYKYFKETGAALSLCSCHCSFLKDHGPLFIPVTSSIS